GSALPRDDVEPYERCREVLRRKLGQEAMSALWSDGRAMTYDGAVAYAIGEKLRDALSRSSGPRLS
ncbi:MAG: hypothetical protein ACYSTY_10540, partial [Planctomycetota bacterium]